MTRNEPLLAFEAVTKSFGAVHALREVSFVLERGEVRALLGENGAGKSTLLKALAGAHAPDSGTLRIEGREQRFTSTQEAFDAGIAVIYQELHLVPELTVAENLLLGQLPAHVGFVDARARDARASELLARLGLVLDPRTRLSSLSLGQRQMIEIGKALARGARILAFDEPTSSLSQRETERLFELIRELAAAGHGILYVTHRMDEVFAVCTSATILRDGELVRTLPRLDHAPRIEVAAEIVRSMVGRELSDVHGWSAREIGAARLELRALQGPGLAEPMNLDVRRGEIVGLFGLVGAGRTELLRLIFGATRAHGGRILVDGADLRARSPRDAIAAGIVLAPEDRKKEGIVPILSVLENVNLSARRRKLDLGIFLRGRWERDNAALHIQQLSIKTPSLATPVRNLSGGNQQKVILARWLSESVKVLLLDEPTRGIDVGARAEIYRIVQELAKSGVAVLMVSSDLPEVLGLSDRVLVMREGRISRELARGEASEEAVLRHALPVHEESFA
ncbi:MAG: L-arabinose ABC transporter ATP-binding protein AraG [Planctomycetes bacterium]|nr:L-arabinose ABC transporter ATP-binding protein AraG [Planctomycetota bacterium]